LFLHAGLLIFRAVAEPRNSGKSTKSRKIHKYTQNAAKFGKNLIKYMSVQHFETYFGYWGYNATINVNPGGGGGGVRARGGDLTI